jgi:hypothetical protein
MWSHVLTRRTNSALSEEYQRKSGGNRFMGVAMASFGVKTL